MTKSTVNRLIDLLRHAVAELAIDLPLLRIEQLAILLHESMDGGKRLYHISEHILTVCETLNPLQTLAGFFHDLVYVQIDEGFPDRTDDLLRKFVEVNEGGEVFIKPAIYGVDRSFDLCLDVFGYQPEQKLDPFFGLNEFLSAVVAVKEFEDHLSPKDLLAVAACIEGTIHFRGLNSEGRDPFDQLEYRLKAASQKHGVDLTDSEVQEIVTLAVVMANKDVEGFAETDPGAFLSDTWILLPETTAVLWSVGVYSIQDYRWALMKMEGFLSFIDPQTVFHRYRDTPDVEQFEVMSRLAQKNVLLAREYLGAKLLTIAILEALALRTGGDAPVSMFLGDMMGTENEQQDRVEDFLPSMTASTELQHDAEILSTLQFGRTSESSFDWTTSPLSSFVYRSLGPDHTFQHLADAKEMFAGELSPGEFLNRIDKEVVQVILKACSMIAISRRDALLQLDV